MRHIYQEKNSLLPVPYVASMHACVSGSYIALKCVFTHQAKALYPLCRTQLPCMVVFRAAPFLSRAKYLSSDHCPEAIHIAGAPDDSINQSDAYWFFLRGETHWPRYMRQNKKYLIPSRGI